MDEIENKKNIIKKIKNSNFIKILNYLEPDYDDYRFLIFKYLFKENTLTENFNLSNIISIIIKL